MWRSLLHTKWIRPPQVAQSICTFYTRCMPIKHGYQYGVTANYSMRWSTFFGLCQLSNFHCSTKFWKLALLLSSTLSLPEDISRAGFQNAELQWTFDKGQRRITSVISHILWSESYRVEITPCIDICNQQFSSEFSLHKSSVMTTLNMEIWNSCC
jgi:hypothetical protein